MGSYATSKMSLLAQYDDLCRHTSVLTTGMQKEFKKFVEQSKQLLYRIKQLESENQKLQKKVHSLETENLSFETKLKHTRGLLVAENDKNRKLETEKNSLERQIALIKELLADGNGIDNQTKEKLVQLSSAYSQQNDLMSKLATIQESGSLLSSSDYDETTDTLENCSTVCEISSRKKSKYPSKRLKASKETIDYISEDDLFEKVEEIVPRKSVSFRSSSEPNSTYPEQLPCQVHRSDSEQVKEHALEVRRNSIIGTRTSMPIGRYSTGGKLSRTHAFVTKTFIRTEKCHPCHKIIKFCKQALKCTDCRINSHFECKDKCPLPCVPVVSTPISGPLGTIADYTSNTAPMIPSLIVHCVNEIESRGLADVGLYRVPGSEREVKELKEKFLKRKTVPSLNEIDVHALCGTIKEFLRSLKDSLITKAAWHTFAEAAELDDEPTRLNLLYDAVSDLPQPNRETLAFLILHLQRIAASPMSKMPINNLSKVFGPTIVGYSIEEPPDMLAEINLQTKVMEGLLTISAKLWQNFLSVDSNVFNNKASAFECLPAPRTSRLGPIYSKQKSKSVSHLVAKTSLSPRSARTANKNGKRQFFSPILK